MAWFRRMGADSVDYHRDTVVGREDDHPGRALAYYGSRGETPLRWGGALAERLGLEGEVTPEAYEAAFGPGGFRDPVTGDRLVKTQRPGFELVFSVHKSVATLGLVGRADDMHAILDVTSGAALAWMDPWMQERGGRRGVAARRTATTGLAYALTRHATSREGDPQAIELGYGIEPDGGKNGRGRHWRLAGCAKNVYRNFSKRADQIGEFMDERGYKSNRAERVAARATRKHKRHTGPDELMPHWHAEMEVMGVTPEGHATAIDAAGWQGGLLPDLTDDEIDQLAEKVLAADGEFMKRHKVFSRFRLVAEVAPALYGRDPAQLDYVLDRILRSKLVVPLVGIEGAYEQAYATAEVLATEQGIARRVERMIDRPGPAVDAEAVEAAMDAKETDIGRPLTAGQRRTVEAVTRSGRAVDVIVGVAGAGNTSLGASARRYVLRHAAHAYSLTGDRDACERALDEGAEAAEAATGDRSPWGTAWFTSAAYLDAQRATCYGRLGRTGESVDLWHTVLSQHPRTAHRDRGVYVARYAAALFDVEGPGAALAAATEAVGCYQHASSARMRHELTQLRNRTAARQDTPAGQDLYEVLRTVD